MRTSGTSSVGRWMFVGIVLPGLVLVAPESRPAVNTGPPVDDTAALVVSNDNRSAAGHLEDGVLTLRLEARRGTWYPEGPQGLARAVGAFAEEGGPLQNPGPLIRVPAGTEVRVNVRNSLDVALTLYGLGAERGVEAETFRLEPGARRELRFKASTPGVYYYAGRTEEPWDPAPPVAVHPVWFRAGPDGQLNGLIVVDPPGADGPARDRLFVITRWGRLDRASPTGIDRDNVLVINGLSWPHTERIEATQGDSIFWRWVSLTALPHPMHLHGFHFRVDAKGDGVQDTTYSPEQRRLAVTETLLAGQTMSIAWSPVRPGNWIFHCHNALHMSPTPDTVLHGGPGRDASHGHHGAGGHTMAQLVLGVHVAPNTEPARVPVAAAKAIRLLVRSQRTPDDGKIRYAYVLGGSAAESDREALPIPGPTLVLEKDQPVAVTVVNQAHDPAAVHWHGIELESFPDGVPDWSGMGNALLRAIPPGDSLTVRFTPPRTGTFMYHSHFNEVQQISSGLYGAIIVLEPGRQRDPDTDRVLLFSDSEGVTNVVTGPFVPPLLNGEERPAPIELRAGVTYRLRLVNIRGEFPVAVSLSAGDQPVTWRHVAKDGAELPPNQAVVRPARLVFAVGEIHDVELTVPAAGELTLRFGYPPGFRPPVVPVPETASVPVHVR